MTGSLRRLLAQSLVRLDDRRGLIILFVAGAVLRLVLAPHFGFYGDLRFFREWADRLQGVPLDEFYSPAVFADYPPGYLYILKLLGAVESPLSLQLLKFPVLLGDLAIAWCSMRIALALAREVPGGSSIPVRPLVVLIALCNPAILAVGAMWGQVDSVPAAFVLGAVVLLVTGRPSANRDLGGMLLYAIAIAMKPQSGLVLPVLAYLLVRRHVVDVRREDRLPGIGRLAVICGLPMLLWAVSGLPFGLTPRELVAFYRESAEVLPVTSANAFNLWGAVSFFSGDREPWKGRLTEVFGVSAFAVGTLLFLVSVVVVLVVLHRRYRAQPLSIAPVLVAAVAINFAGFVLFTRMHERYLFPTIALMTPLVVVPAYRRLYAVLSGLFVLNLWYPYAYFNIGWREAGFPVRALYPEQLFEAVFGDTFTFDTWQKRMWSLLVTATFIAFMVVFIRNRSTTTALSTASDQVTAAAATPEPTSTDRPLAAPRWSLPARYAPDFGAADRIVSRWERQIALGVLVVATATMLLVNYSELITTPQNNDTSFHRLMVDWAVGQWRDGRVPFDGWFPDLTLGSSFFHHYQSLPHTVTALGAVVTGASPFSAMGFATYLLLAVWPLSFFVGARLVGLGRLPSAGAAVVAPLLVSTTGYGFELGSYLSRGYGVYSQLFGMVLMPIAFGAAWRAISTGRHLATAAGLLALTIASHLLTAYLLLVCLGVIALVTVRPFTRALLRAGLVCGGGVGVAAWVLVPLLGDARYSAQSVFYIGSIFNDSHPAGEILEWLATGELLDAGRLPVITFFALVGLIVSATRARRSAADRALVTLFLTSLVLFFGRATWGGLADLLPGARDLQMHRFISGVHLSAVLFAGIGMITVLRIIIGYATRIEIGPRSLVVGAASLVALGPVLVPVIERVDYATSNIDFIRFQQQAERADGLFLDTLFDEVGRRGDGRVYSGLRSNWGKDYKVGYTPVLNRYAEQSIDAIGFTFRTVQSLSNDIEAYFDETNPAHYEMMNVRYVIVPEEREPAVPASLLLTSGRHRLYEVQASGYVRMVNRAGVITADRADLAAANRDFMAGSDALVGNYPAIDFDGDGVPPGYAFGDGVPGEVLEQSQDAERGLFRATVRADRTATVLLAATFDPRWTATIDGRPASPIMMAPSLVGVDVPPGEHVVEFRYDPISTYPLLLTFGLVVLVGLWFTSRPDRIPQRVTEALRRVSRK
jgi:hypothetical protein